MFMDGFTQIKTQVKFASDFHRDRKERKKGEEVHHADKKQEIEDESSLK
jgi:hypothetical protein